MESLSGARHGSRLETPETILQACGSALKVFSCETPIQHELETAPQHALLFRREITVYILQRVNLGLPFFLWRIQPVVARCRFLSVQEEMNGRESWWCKQLNQSPGRSKWLSLMMAGTLDDGGQFDKSFGSLLRMSWRNYFAHLLPYTCSAGTLGSTGFGYTWLKRAVWWRSLCVSA